MSQVAGLNCDTDTGWDALSIHKHVTLNCTPQQIINFASRSWIGVRPAQLPLAITNHTKWYSRNSTAESLWVVTTNQNLGSQDGRLQWRRDQPSAWVVHCPYRSHPMSMWSIGISPQKTCCGNGPVSGSFWGSHDCEDRATKAIEHI